MQRRLNILTESRYFSKLESRQLHALVAASRRVELERGDVVVRAGAPQTAVCYVTCGTLALYRQDADRKTGLLLGLVQGPALIGDAECAAKSPWIVSVRAEEQGECLLIENEAFLAAARANAHLAFHLYQDASVRHLLANYTAQMNSLHSVEERLIRLVLDYARCFGRRAGNQVIIERRATIAAFASALGVNRRTIERALGPLESAGIITRLPEAGGLRIDHVPRLREMLPRDLLGLGATP